MIVQQAVDWLNSRVGQYWDFDGKWLNQCVDSFNFYYQFLTGRNPYSDGYGVPGARNLWDVPTNVFTKIPDSASLTPQPGDVIIYDSRWGGGFGHVEMVVAVQADGVWVVGSNFTNDPSRPVQKAFRPWKVINSGIKGVMRPNVFTQGEPPMTKEEEANAYQIVLNRPMEHNGSGRTGYKFILDAKAELDAQRSANAKLVADLQALANKPPVEVVKEVEKIVTEYVDRPVIQEVTKPFTDEDGKNWLINLFKRIFKR